MKQQLPRISVRNLQRKVRVDVVDLEKFAQRAVELCLRLPGSEKTELEAVPQISVMIVSDRHIGSLHQRFMRQSGPTDVITFQHGEIFISAETARRNARRFKNPIERELRLYIAHALLHLHGFDDHDAAGIREMKLVQERIVKCAEM
jgi:probable rRNA maturation factor